MDPSEALRILREWAQTDAVDDPDATSLALDAWRGLDEWLSRGGFLPRDWARPA